MASIDDTVECVSIEGRAKRVTDPADVDVLYDLFIQSLGSPPA